MADLDTLAPNYGRWQRRWPDASNLESAYKAIGECLSGNPRGLVEHTKSFVETVCITVLTEFDEEIPGDLSLTELLVRALRPLGLRNSRGASKLDRVLSGFNKLADAITDMRNEEGPIAHGRDAFIDSITTDHARAFFHAGDALLSVLWAGYQGQQPNLRATREPYVKFVDFNDQIDAVAVIDARVDDSGETPVFVLRIQTGNPSEATELRIHTSRLLFGVDRDAYVEALRSAAASAAAADDESEIEPVTQDVQEPAPLSPPPAEAPPIVPQVVHAYEGDLSVWQEALAGILDAHAISSNQTVGDNRLIDSVLQSLDENLGLDWAGREPMLARLRVTVKRVLSRFGIERMKADKAASEIVAWCSRQVANVAESTDAIASVSNSQGEDGKVHTGGGGA
jgi:hypothetical protein